MKELFYMFRKKTDIDKIFDKTFETLRKEYEMFMSVRKTLRESNQCETTIDISKEDKKINKFQMESRRKIFTELALSGPEELNAGLVLMSILIDVERIGDYFKNIVELAKIHPKKLKGGDVEKTVHRIEKRMLKIFESTLDSFKEKDKDKGRDAMQLHSKVTCDIDNLLSKLLKNKVGGLNPGEAVALALYLRFLKRITSHLTNIASSVVNPLERIGYVE
jgi:phosphate uptake regulator